LETRWANRPPERAFCGISPGDSNSAPLTPGQASDPLFEGDDLETRQHDLPLYLLQLLLNLLVTRLQPCQPCFLF
jgi:hypothetical protein